MFVPGSSVSACGEKSSPSPWSSPRRRGNNIRCLAVHRRPSTSGDQALSAAAGRPIQCERPNAIPSPGGEGQDEGELPAPKAVTSFSRGGSPQQIESNLVRVRNFHRGDAEARRGCGVGEGARERVVVSGDGGRGESNQKRLKAKGLRRKVGEGGTDESNQVQAIDFFQEGADAGGVCVRACSPWLNSSPARRGRASRLSVAPATKGES